MQCLVMSAPHLVSFILIGSCVGSTATSFFPSSAIASLPPHQSTNGPRLVLGQATLGRRCPLVQLSLPHLCQALVLSVKLVRMMLCDREQLPLRHRLRRHPSNLQLASSASAYSGYCRRPRPCPGQRH